MPARTRKQSPSTEPEQAQPQIHTIHTNTVYTAVTFRQVFGLRNSSLRREVREKRLRVFKRCGRYYILGEDVLAWLRGGTRSSTNGTPDP